MSIRWVDLARSTNRIKLMQELRVLLTPEKYWDEWTLTELIIEEDTRKFTAFQVFDGVQADGTIWPDSRPVIPFRLRVLTRQACIEDKKGNKIWERHEARDAVGSPSDIVPDHDDPPEPGDIVEIKGRRITHDPDTGKIVDAKILKKWAVRGKRPEQYDRFIVDNDGCITVYWPHAKRMLERYGKQISKARFRRLDKRDKTKRKITNWRFEEVAPDFRGPSSKSNKPSKNPTFEALTRE